MNPVAEAQLQAEIAETMYRGSKIWQERFEVERRRANALLDALEAARRAFVDMTFVGINIDKAPYPTNEAKIRNLACQGAIRASDAIEDGK